MAFIRGLNPKAAMGIGIKITPAIQKEFIQKKLSTNKVWATQALLKVYALQTAIEQEQEATRETNNKGFTGVDAEILSSFAKQYQTRGFLSPKQMVYVYKKMPKYWGQIVKISNAQHLETLIRNSLS